MQVSIYQGPKTATTVEKHLEIMARQARAAADRGSNLLIFPEMYLTGYNIGAKRTHELAQPASGPGLTRAAQIAADNNIAILFGFPERDQDRVYNSAIMYDESGHQTLLYRKSHLFGDIDRNAFAPGENPCDIVEFHGVKMAVLICYDIEFAENVRHLALSGADFIAVPTALMWPYEFVPTKLVPTRAFENQVFIAYANRCDTEAELSYYGLSCICAPDGTDLARAHDGEALITATLDFELQRSSRLLNTHIADRRPELYGKLVE